MTDGKYIEGDAGFAHLGSGVCKRWPLAGKKLTDGLIRDFDLDPDHLPKIITFKGYDSQTYRITEGYLIPNYTPRNDSMDRSQLSERNEELIIDRARAFTMNAQPELGVLRTANQLDAAIAAFRELPEENHRQMATKAAQFKLLTGGIIMRLEMLGRMICQRNTQGVRTEYLTLTGKSIDDGGIPVLAPQSTGIRQLNNEEVAHLLEEAKGYYRFLTDFELRPWQRTVLLTDKKIDLDGVLIDLAREIGKGLGIKTEANEKTVRGLIVKKIGGAAESIDQLHAQLRQAITDKPTASLFEQSIAGFIRDHGEDYHVHTVADVVANLDRYAALCRARCSIRSDDEAYDEVVAEKFVLSGFFNGENGLLQCMKRVGRSSGNNISEFRGLLSRGIKLMDRTSYTRTPCNENAPDVWIPDFTSETPIEHYLIRQYLTPPEQTRYKKVLAASEGLPKEDRVSYLNKEFSSVGRLTSDFATLRQHIKGRDTSFPSKA